MLQGQSYQVVGNKEVQDLLRKYLKLAELGKIDWVGLVAISESIDMFPDYAGANSSLCSAFAGLELLKDRIKAAMAADLLPHPTRPTADRWVYNLARGPASFDFMGWLVQGIMTMRREGAPGPLRVHFHLGGHELNPPIRRQMLEKVMRPLLQIFGAVEDPKPNGGRISHNYSFAPIVAAYEQGEELPEIGRIVLNNDPLGSPVTITLRECAMPHRNSNTDEWMLFARWLRKQGENVVFVRDTDRANDKIDGFPICPEASVDLIARTALYQSAKANLFVSNGPAGIAYFTEVPWLVWQKVSNDDPYYYNTAEGFRSAMGIDVKGQWPWATEQQRFVWEEDTFESMRNAWEGLQLSKLAA